MSQLNLKIERERQKDRNHSKGGRSFYFFDFDDNIAFLETPIYIFHKKTGEEMALSSGEFARKHQDIGRCGEFRQFEIRAEDPMSGSFRNFRDQEDNLSNREEQRFVSDILRVLQQAGAGWKGPSWNCFYHAVFNQRPVSIITARGHAPETVKFGINQFLKHKYLPCEPNYLDVFPVSHPQIQEKLDATKQASVAELKKSAIKASVEQAFSTYGENPYHRFGMSDDDSRNVELITEAMCELKKEFPENSFFVFDSSRGELFKREVLTDRVLDQKVEALDQLSLFS